MRGVLCLWLLIPIPKSLLPPLSPQPYLLTSIRLRPRSHLPILRLPRGSRSRLGAPLWAGLSEGYVVELGGGLSDLSQNLRKGGGVVLKLGAKLLKLGIVLEVSHEAGGGGMSLGLIPRDAVEKVLYGSFYIPIWCSKGCDALLSREAHGRHVIDLGLGGFRGGLAFDCWLLFGFNFLFLLTFLRF